MKTPSIRTRVALLFLASTAAPLLLLAALAGLHGLRATRRALEEQAAAQVASQVERVRGAHDDVRDEYRNLCWFLFSYSTEWGEALAGSSAAERFSYGVGMQIRTLYWQFVLADSSGRPIVRAWAPVSGGVPGRYQFSRTSRAAFEPADTLAGSACIEEPRGTIVTARHRDPPRAGMLRLAARVASPGGARGLLLADLRLTDLFERVLGPVGSEPASGGAAPDAALRISTFAADALSGTVLYHADPAKLGRLASEMGLPPGLDEPVTRWIGDRLLRGRPVPEIGVLMCADVDAAPLIVPARRAAAFMMAAACAIVIVAGVLVAILTRGFRSSLRELVVASDAVARGDFGHRVPVRSQDELGHLAGSMNRMAAEVQNLTRAREIEARLASVARVGAALAHDLKGMVMGLSLLAENLEQRYASPGSRERALETLRTLAARMKRMVLRLGTAPPPETVRPDRVDLNRLLRGAAETLGLCAESRLAIVEAFADPAPVVRGDEDGLARVAQNLLSNAGEAMPEGGTLTLGTAETVEGGIPMALFTVGDSGPGMDPRFVEERLFRPFETTKQSGLGLGLFSSREFIERHGGTIRVRTTPGGGTTFEVRLPAIRNTEDA